MKKTKIAFTQKLFLRKETVAQLNRAQQEYVLGGANTRQLIAACFTYTPIYGGPPGYLPGWINPRCLKEEQGQEMWFPVLVVYIRGLSLALTRCLRINDNLVHPYKGIPSLVVPGSGEGTSEAYRKDRYYHRY